MSPTNWVMLFMFFSSIFFIFNCLIYFMYSPEVSNMNKVKSKSELTQKYWKLQKLTTMNNMIKSL